MAPLEHKHQSDLNARAAQALVARLRAGDSSVLDDILNHYGRTLLDIAIVVTGTHDLAKDAVQDVLINVWDNRADLTIRSSLAGYLVNAVRNRAISLSRHEQAQHRLETQIQTAYPDANIVDPPQEDDSLNPERSADIRTALGDLPPRSREILLLRVDLEMSYAEIAETLGIAVNTVRVQLYTATKTLAQRLGRWRNLMLL